MNIRLNGNQNLICTSGYPHILPLVYDIPLMDYEVYTTNIFDKWLVEVKDTKHRARIINRFEFSGVSAALFRDGVQHHPHLTA